MNNYKGTKEEILKFLYAVQYCDRKLMRSLGYSYDNTGRIITAMEKAGYVEEFEIEDDKILALTKEGCAVLNDTFYVDDRILRYFKEKNKGNENKIRQYKLGCTLEMLNRYIPNYCEDYLKLEDSIINPRTYKDGMFYSGNAWSNANNAAQRSDKIKNIQTEIKRRIEQSGEANSCFITTREMRQLDADGLKNLSAVRAQGLFNFNGKLFVVYNHLHKKMRKYGDFDERFKDFCSEITDSEVKNSIIFAKTYKVAIDTLLNTPSGQTDSFIISSMVYKNQYFAPLTYDGAKQLQIYGIKDFKQIIKEGILNPIDMNRAKNLHYDGIDSDGNIIFIGFECNITDLYCIKENLQTIRAGSRIIVHCFNHQVGFYQRIFGERAEIMAYSIEDVIDFCR